MVFQQPNIATSMDFSFPSPSILTANTVIRYSPGSKLSILKVVSLVWLTTTLPVPLWKIWYLVTEGLEEGGGDWEREQTCKHVFRDTIQAYIPSMWLRLNCSKYNLLGSSLVQGLQEAHTQTLPYGKYTNK